MSPADTPAILKPVFRDLPRREIDAILRRNNVGRIAFVAHGVVTIEPIHYVYGANWIHCRTAPGTKLEAIAHVPWVAFEVDEIDSLFEWRSAVVHGTTYISDPKGTEAQRRAFARGVSALRKLLPQTFLADDPVPFRKTVFGVYVHEAAGREAAQPGTPRSRSARGK